MVSATSSGTISMSELPEPRLSAWMANMFVPGLQQTQVLRNIELDELTAAARRGRPSLRSSMLDRPARWTRRLSRR